MKCKVLTIVIAFLMAIAGVFRASATAQGVDYLFIDGEKHYIIRSYPLQDLIDKTIPNNYNFPTFKASSTANYKGYVAYWEIEDNKLYLTAIHDEGNAPRGKRYINLDLKEIFGKDCVDGRVHAKWATENLALGFGEIRKWWEGTGPLTSYRKIVQVKSGRCKMMGEYEYYYKSIDEKRVEELSQEVHNAIAKDWKWRWSEVYHPDFRRRLSIGMAQVHFGVRNGKVAFKDDYWTHDRMKEYKRYIYKKIKRVDWDKYLEKDQAIYFTTFIEIDGKKQKIEHFNIF